MLQLGEPRVTTTFFDGPVNVTEHEVIDTGSSGVGVLYMDQRGDATCHAFEDFDGTNVQLYLPNGRRTTAHVIEAGADDTVRGESGPQEDTGAGPHPGSKYTLVTDAVGATRNYVTPNPLDSHIPSSFADNDPTDMPQTGACNLQEWRSASGLGRYAGYELDHEKRKRRSPTL